MKLTLDTTKKIVHDGDKYIIPVKTEEGAEINLSMSEEDMNKFMEVRMLTLTPECNEEVH